MSERLEKTVFDWEHFFVYLAGPIDFDPDGGTGWREKWTERLVETGFKKSQIFNPRKKPIHAKFNLDDEQDLMRQHRSNENWDDLCEVMSQIVHIDLRLVDKSDIIIVNMPKYSEDPNQPILDSMQVHTYGTIHEIVSARQRRTPVFLVWEGGKEGCSAWLMWLVGHKNVFGSLDELLERLSGISSGKIAYNAKDWLLLDLD